MTVSQQQLIDDGIDPATFYYAARIISGAAEMPDPPDSHLTHALNYIKEKHMPKGRKTTAAAEVVGPDFVSATPPALAARESAMHLSSEQTETNVRAVAEHLGYQLPADCTSPDMIMRDIAANMRRSVEACLEVGKALRVLKEACSHGEFVQRLDALGMERTVAARFMQAAGKFSNVASTQLLKAAGNQTKLLEMLVLDDEQIEELELTGQTGELSLDDVATMSVKELRAALREAKETAAAKDRLIADKNAKLDQLATKKGRVKTEKPDDILVDLRRELMQFAVSAEAELTNRLRPAFRAMTDHHATHGGDSRDYLSGCLAQIERVVLEIREEFDLTAGQVVEWAGQD